MIQKFNKFNENKSEDVTISDALKILDEIEIVYYLYRCGLIDQFFNLYEDDVLNWENTADIVENWATQVEYGDEVQIPLDTNLPRLVKKVRAYAKTNKDFTKYILRLNK